MGDGSAPCRHCGEWEILYGGYCSEECEKGTAGVLTKPKLEALEDGYEELVILRDILEDWKDVKPVFYSAYNMAVDMEKELDAHLKSIGRVKTN